MCWGGCWEEQLKGSGGDRVRRGRLRCFAFMAMEVIKDGEMFPSSCGTRMPISLVEVSRDGYGGLKIIRIEVICRGYLVFRTGAGGLSWLWGGGGQSGYVFIAFHSRVSTIYLNFYNQLHSSPSSTHFHPLPSIKVPHPSFPPDQKSSSCPTPYSSH